MSKVKSTAQIKADMERLMQQYEAAKKELADRKKKERKASVDVIGEAFLNFFSDEDLSSKSKADLRKFVTAICEKAVANDDDDESEDMTDEGVSDDEDEDEDEEESETDEDESESQNKSHRPYNPMFGA